MTGILASLTALPGDALLAAVVAFAIGAGVSWLLFALRRGGGRKRRKLRSRRRKKTSAASTTCFRTNSSLSPPTRFGTTARASWNW